MFCDASCSRCGKRFGWTGKMSDCPPCPRCGYRPHQDEINSDINTLREAGEFFREWANRKEVESCWTQMRFSAGLTVVQASKQLEIPCSILVSIEAQEASPLPWLQQKINQIYSNFKQADVS